MTFFYYFSLKKRQYSYVRHMYLQTIFICYIEYSLIKSENHISSFKITKIINKQE